MGPDNLLSGLDLENPMSGFDARSDVHFEEDPCVVAELRRGFVRCVPSDLTSLGSLTLLQSSKCSKYVQESISPEQVDDWIDCRVSDPD
jgi:hypothetical protein